MKLLRQKRGPDASKDIDRRRRSESNFRVGLPTLPRRVLVKVWVEMTLGMISAVSLSLAIVMPNWMERLFQLAPDAGDGSAERGFALLWAVISTLMFGLAGRTWQKHAQLRRTI